MTRRHAVIVGVGQRRRRPLLDGPFEPWEPTRLMAAAFDAALHDACRSDIDPADLRLAVDTVAVVDPIAWTYDDLCAATIEEAGLTPGIAGVMVPPGGNAPGELLGLIVERILGGESEAAALLGSECLYGRRRAVKEGVRLDWRAHTGRRDVLKGQRPLTTALEARHGITAPIHCYPLFENALRAESGRSVEAHEAFLGTFMARNAAVAARNPYAWFPQAYEADEIVQITDKNRWVCFPYPKLMNAIMEVDLSAALIVLSNEEADRREIPLSQRVSILGVGAARDSWAPCERPSFAKSPAIAAAAEAAFDHANMSEGAAGVDRFDLYSCFPSAVQMGLHALGVEPDDPRGVTVTGGLAYAGGPGNSYAVHSLAAMTEVIRNGDARVGLVSGLGMAASKHAVAVLSNDPRRIEAADGGFHYAPVAPELTSGPVLVDGVSGEGTVETYTVEYQRDGSILRTMFVVRLDDGTRTVANGTADLAEVRAITEHEGVGRRCTVVGGTPPAVALPKDHRLVGVDLGEPNRVSLV